MYRHKLIERIWVEKKMYDIKVHIGRQGSLYEHQIRQTSIREYYQR